MSEKKQKKKKAKNSGKTKIILSCELNLQSYILIEQFIKYAYNGLGD